MLNSSNKNHISVSYYKKLIRIEENRRKNQVIDFMIINLLVVFLISQPDGRTKWCEE